MPGFDLKAASMASLLRERERRRRYGHDTYEIDVEIERRQYQRDEPRLKTEDKESLIENRQSMVSKRVADVEDRRRGLTERERSNRAREGDRTRRTDLAYKGQASNERYRSAVLELMRDRLAAQSGKAMGDTERRKYADNLMVVRDRRDVARQTVLDLERRIRTWQDQQRRAAETLAMYGPESRSDPASQAAQATLDQARRELMRLVPAMDAAKREFETAGRDYDEHTRAFQAFVNAAPPTLAAGVTTTQPANGMLPPPAPPGTQPAPAGPLLPAPASPTGGPQMAAMAPDARAAVSGQPSAFSQTRPAAAGPDPAVIARLIDNARRGSREAQAFLSQQGIAW